MRKLSFIIYHLSFIVCAILIVACSSTSNQEPGELLYTGMKQIEWNSTDDLDLSTKTDVEQALSKAPNRAIFGSPYHRNPFSFGIYIWNATRDTKGGFGKWLRKFGTEPVMLKDVNVPLRLVMAKNMLASHGYFRGYVTADTILGEPKAIKKDSVSRPRTAMLKYHVTFGKPYLFDNITYTNFPDEFQKSVSADVSFLRQGNPFSVATLENERTRITEALRNDGYYFFNRKYISFHGDTISVPEKVKVDVHLADSLGSDVLRKWKIGTVSFGDDRPPVRQSVLMQQMMLRQDSIFTQRDYLETMNNMNSLGVFSAVDINFTKRNAGTLTGDTARVGILDMTVDCTMDKLWDISVGAKAVGKSNKRLRPGIDITLSRRNVFHGGESLSLTAGVGYEFQLGGGASSSRNSYDFSLTGSLDFPRLLLPSFSRKKNRNSHWYSSPSTSISLNAKMQRRSGFFTKNSFSFDYSYSWNSSPTSQHKWTPLSVLYGFMEDMSEEYLKQVSVSTMLSNLDEFTPKMSYSYTYRSPSSYSNPLSVSATVTEAGTLTNLVFMAAGKKKWNDKGKEILGAPFSQFVKLEADIRKSWQTSENSSFVIHAYAGWIKPFGNDQAGTFTELFHIGGANDLRGFALRTLGPGELHFENSDWQYMMHFGDVKAYMNLEYRPKLFGSLYGALFLDAGNIWLTGKFYRDLYKDKFPSTTKFDAGIDVGVGLRYNLGFFVVRLDWGFAIHRPYSKYVSDDMKWTEGQGGFFNIRRFKEMQCLNFAIGYPF